MQIALRHLQECFYMQSSEMMLAYKILFGGECTLVVREPPAEPEKLSYLSPEGTFPKIWSISESCKKPLRQLEFLENA